MTTLTREPAIVPPNETVSATRAWCELREGDTADALVGYEISSWHGFFAPARTPRGIIDRLHREIARALQLPEMRRRIESTGNQAVGSTPEEFEVKFRADIAKFKKIVQDARIPYQD
jgi:Tripartite tricarboxylate transporter family receptor